MPLSTKQTGPRTDTDSRILDAAYAQVMAVGFRRTTLTDVAERAGLSRMTVYRRYPDVVSVLQALMWREFSAVAEEARNETGSVEGKRERIVATAVRGLDLLSTHELFVRLLDVDPELLLPYMTQRPGRLQDAAVEELTTLLDDAIASGAVRRDDPERLARSMVLAMRGYAFSARDGASRRRRRATLDDMARMFDGLLRPDARRL
jgi:AcrR family transcriptional regulator